MANMLMPQQFNGKSLLQWPSVLKAPIQESSRLPYWVWHYSYERLILQAYNDHGQHIAVQCENRSELEIMLGHLHRHGAQVFAEEGTQPLVRRQA